MNTDQPSLHTPDRNIARELRRLVARMLNTEERMKFETTQEHHDAWDRLAALKLELSSLAAAFRDKH